MKNDENISEMEYIQDDKTLGIRFLGILEQYIVVNNKNMKELLKNIGYSEEQLSNIPETFEFNTDFYDVLKFTQQELENIKSRYVNILFKGLSNSNFSKKGNQTIEINGNNIRANAYVITLTKEQLNNIYINILEELKQDETILSKIDKLQEFISQYKIIIGEIENLRGNFEKKLDNLKNEIIQTNIGENQCNIIVYESEGKTVKNVIQGVGYELDIDTLPLEKYIKISYKDTINEKEKSFTCKKSNEQLDISYNNISNSETSEYSISVNEDIQENNCKRNTIVKYEDNKNKVELNIDNSIKIVESIKNKVTLDNENSININEVDSEETKEKLNELYTNINEKSDDIQNNIISAEDINEILVAAKLRVEEQSIEYEGITKTEINRFNSKFEILQGEDLANTDVLNIIDIIKDNLIGLDVISDTQLRLNIDRNDNNEDAFTTIKQFIEKNTSKRYNAKVEYNEETKLVEDVLLEIVEKK